MGLLEALGPESSEVSKREDAEKLLSARAAALFPRTRGARGYPNQRATIEQELRELIAAGEFYLTDVLNAPEPFATLAREALLGWTQGERDDGVPEFVEMQISLRWDGDDSLVRIGNKKSGQTTNGYTSMKGQKRFPLFEPIVRTLTKGFVWTSRIDEAIDLLDMHGEFTPLGMSAYFQKGRHLVEVESAALLIPRAPAPVTTPKKSKEAPPAAA